LNHIKFDLVPATTTWLTGLQIPNDSDGWMSTTPNDFNTTVEAKNKEHNSLIKPTIRLFKYWNATSGYPFESFMMEKWICNQSFWFVTNQKDYFFEVIDKLNINSSNSQWVNNEITRTKNIVTKIRQYEKDGSLASAESEIMKLFRL
jgi:hypothetical protein